MTGRLDGKQAFVTGAAQGIGRAIAEAFLREGAQVVAADLNADGLADLTGPRVETLALDATDPEQLQSAAARWSGVTALINCVGFVESGSILDCPPATLERSFAINVMSMHHAIAAFLPAMLARGEGAIINIASIVSSSRGAPNRYAYGASKGAVIGLTKAVARDFINRGVRCNSISPGTVQSPSLDERIAAQDDPQAARAAFVARQPMGRVGRPEEIAAVAVLLASDEAAFMSGADIVVDGGWSL